MGGHSVYRRSFEKLKEVKVPTFTFTFLYIIFYE